MPERGVKIATIMRDAVGRLSVVFAKSMAVEVRVAKPEKKKASALCVHGCGEDGSSRLTIAE